MKFTEEKLEKAVIELFEAEGCKHLTGEQSFDPNSPQFYSWNAWAVVPGLFGKKRIVPLKRGNKEGNKAYGTNI